MRNETIIDPARAPLYEAIIAHHDTGPVSFHVPGHKSGQGLAPEARSIFQPVMAVDYTEITGLDDLHQPEGVIRDAQRLAARCFGAEETFFLVGGSTAGNLAMIMSVCDRGDMIIVQRNVHKSVIHGIMLAGARAVFLPPRWDPGTGMSTGVYLKDVESALQTQPKAKAVLLSNPNYYGMGIDLKPFAELIHSHGKPLLVDEAHGAHFGFHPELPPSALYCGADAVVQSTHKMLTAMTMGAMLHIQGKLVNSSIIKRYLSILQSSSPSYPILASLDLARRQMHTEGKELLEQGLQVVRSFTGRMEQLECYGLIPEAGSTDSVYDTKDPFKVGICDRTGTLTGPELKEQLEQNGCYVEMADTHYVLLLFTLASTQDDAEKLYRILQNISNQYQLQKKELASTISNIMKIPQFTQISEPIALDLQTNRSWNHSDSQVVEQINIQDAAHRYAAEMVIPYPPGIPLLYPGEKISPAAAAYLQQLVTLGNRFHGDFGQDNKITVLK